MVSLKRLHFSTYHCVFFPTVAIVRILVGRLDLCFLTHTKKYMTPMHAIIFEKHVKMCVYARHVKSRHKFVTLWGSTHSKNNLAGRSFFQNLGSQGPGRVSPGGSSRAAPSTFFAACYEASGASVV